MHTRPPQTAWRRPGRFADSRFGVRRSAHQRKRTIIPWFPPSGRTRNYEVGMSIQAPDVGLTEFHQYLIRCRDPRVSGGRARRPFLCAVQNAENVDSITGDSIVLQHIRNDRLYGNCGCEQLGCKLTMWPRFSSSIAELETINRAARWDYQRDHFYIRTGAQPITLNEA
jgi:hypothetical protein